MTWGSHIAYYSLIFFIAYAFKGQVHVFAGWVKIVKSLVLQDKCNIEIFFSLRPFLIQGLWLLNSTYLILMLNICMKFLQRVNKIFGHFSAKQGQWCVGWWGEGRLPKLVHRSILVRVFLCLTCFSTVDLGVQDSSLLSLNKGITVFKIFSWGGISLYPHSNAFMQFRLKFERCKQHRAPRHPTKCDIINDVKLFPTVSQMFEVIHSDVTLQTQEH